MAKTVYLESGSYKIKVADASNEITLESALTRVTGDLRIEGETTTVNTTNLAIEDNIIELNKNEVGSGVGEGTAGVRVDRGTLNGVQMIYDESIAWNNPSTQTVSQGPNLQGPGYGSYKISSSDGNDILALRVANINNNNAIYFEPGGTGTLRLGASIAPANYISRMGDDNDIPNKKYVDDEINAVVIGAAFPRIVQGDTEVKITDNSTSGQTSKIEVTIDGTSNIPGTMPVHASELYAKNITSFLNYMIKDGALNLDLEDEIISGAMFAHRGKITNKQTSTALEEL